MVRATEGKGETLLHDCACEVVNGVVVVVVGLVTILTVRAGERRRRGSRRAGERSRGVRSCLLLLGLDERTRGGAEEVDNAVRHGDDEVMGVCAGVVSFQ